MKPNNEMDQWYCENQCPQSLQDYKHQTKLILVYENGKGFKTPCRVVLNARIMHNYKCVIAEVLKSIKINSSSGIKGLFTTNGERVTEAEKLVNGGSYVLVGSEPGGFIAVQYGNQGKSILVYENGKTSCAPCRVTLCARALSDWQSVLAAALEGLLNCREKNPCGRKFGIPVFYRPILKKLSLHAADGTKLCSVQQLEDNATYILVTPDTGPFKCPNHPCNCTSITASSAITTPVTLARLPPISSSNQIKGPEKKADHCFSPYQLVLRKIQCDDKKDKIENKKGDIEFIEVFLPASSVLRATYNIEDKMKNEAPLSENNDHNCKSNFQSLSPQYPTKHEEADCTERMCPSEDFSQTVPVPNSHLTTKETEISKNEVPFSEVDRCKISCKVCNAYRKLLKDYGLSPHTTMTTDVYFSSCPPQHTGEISYGEVLATGRGPPIYSDQSPSNMVISVTDLPIECVKDSHSTVILSAVHSNESCLKRVAEATASPPGKMQPQDSQCDSKIDSITHLVEEIKKDYLTPVAKTSKKASGSGSNNEALEHKNVGTQSEKDVDSCQRNRELLKEACAAYHMILKNFCSDKEDSSPPKNQAEEPPVAIQPQPPAEETGDNNNKENKGKKEDTSLTQPSKTTKSSKDKSDAPESSKKRRSWTKSKENVSKNASNCVDEETSDSDENMSSNIQLLESLWKHINLSVKNNGHISKLRNKHHLLSKVQSSQIIEPANGQQLRYFVRSDSSNSRDSNEIRYTEKLHDFCISPYNSNQSAITSQPLKKVSFNASSTLKEAVHRASQTQCGWHGNDDCSEDIDLKRSFCNDEDDNNMIFVKNMNDEKGLISKTNLSNYSHFTSLEKNNKKHIDLSAGDIKKNVSHIRKNTEMIESSLNHIYYKNLQIIRALLEPTSSDDLRKNTCNNAGSNFASSNTDKSCLKPIISHNLPTYKNNLYQKQEQSKTGMILEKTDANNHLYLSDEDQHFPDKLTSKNNSVKLPAIFTADQNTSPSCSLPSLSIDKSINFSSNDEAEPRDKQNNVLRWETNNSIYDTVAQFSAKLSRRQRKECLLHHLAKEASFRLRIGQMQKRNISALQLQQHNQQQRCPSTIETNRSRFLHNLGVAKLTSQAQLLEIMDKQLFYIRNSPPLQ